MASAVAVPVTTDPASAARSGRQTPLYIDEDGFQKVVYLTAIAHEQGLCGNRQGALLRWPGLRGWFFRIRSREYNNKINGLIGCDRSQGESRRPPML